MVLTPTFVPVYLDTQEEIVKQVRLCVKTQLRFGSIPK